MIMARSSFALSKTWIRSLQQPVKFFLVALSTICQTVVSPVDLLLARPSRALFRDLIFSFSNVICNQVLSSEVCVLATLNTFGFVFPNFGNCAFFSIPLRRLFCVLLLMEVCSHFLPRITFRYLQFCF
jgi:hypothetical protein